MSHNFPCRRLVILSFLFIYTISYADELCDQALTEGKQNYKAEQYDKAKELFAFVISECGASYGDAGTWIKKCDAALSNTTASIVQVPLSSVGSQSASTNTAPPTTPTNSSTQVSTQAASTGLSQSDRRRGNTASAPHENQKDNSRQDTRKNITSPSGKIQSVIAQQDVVQNGERGMLVKVSFEVSDMTGKEGIWRIVKSLCLCIDVTESEDEEFRVVDAMQFGSKGLNF